MEEERKNKEREDKEAPDEVEQEVVCNTTLCERPQRTGFITFAQFEEAYHRCV
jgi:hypothetical protein